MLYNIPIVQKWTGFIRVFIVYILNVLFRNAKSKVNSLVTRRTVSLEDLHEAVVRVGFPLNVSQADHGKLI